jgi:hypothetical protein
VLGAATAFATRPAIAGGNADAAHACQQNGYLSLHRSDGSSFKNTGACVSYFAHGGTAGCTVTATTGCLVFDNVVMPDLGSTGHTVTVNAAFSFNSTCNSLDPDSPCPSLPNNYATGGGTYVIRDASGNVVEQGTLTTNDTPGTNEGLDGTGYEDNTGMATTCAGATNLRAVGIVASTGLATDPWVSLGDNMTGPFNDGWFTPVNSGQIGDFDSGFNAPGVTVTC